MNDQAIRLDPLKCNGCGDCVAACSMWRVGLNDPAMSCIRVHQAPSPIDDHDAGFFYLPVTCFHCEAPPCLAVCPREAITRDESLGRVLIDTERCIGCKRCVAACPFGAMRFDEQRGRSFKCDHCAGEPECVRVCEPLALAFVARAELNAPQLRDSAMLWIQALKARSA